jgi:hypothetical protein
MIENRETAKITKKDAYPGVEQRSRICHCCISDRCRQFGHNYPVALAFPSLLASQIQGLEVQHKESCREF